MWNRGLQPRFFSGCLSEPGPYCRYVQNAQILEKNASTKAQGLNDKVIEKVVGRSWEVGGQYGRNVNRIFDNLRYDSNEAGRKSRE